MKMEFLNGKGHKDRSGMDGVFMAFFLAALFFSIPVQALSDDEVKARAVLLELEPARCYMPRMPMNLVRLHP